MQEVDDGTRSWKAPRGPGASLMRHPRGGVYFGARFP